MTLYFSRLTLNREARASALMPLINPEAPEQAADAHHRLIWSVFSDSRARDRDFLWRYDGKGRFYTLSARPPQTNELFTPHAIKTFEPDLATGDRLQFTLRTNATRARRIGPRKSQRVDVVMDLLKSVPPGSERADARRELVQTAAEAWLERQGAVKGFAARRIVAEGYSTLELGRTRRQGTTFGILELTGLIEVTDPAEFLPALELGFGRAKAWGCGLMLIRRAL